MEKLHCLLPPAGRNPMFPSKPKYGQTGYDRTRTEAATYVIHLAREGPAVQDAVPGCVLKGVCTPLERLN